MIIVVCALEAEARPIIDAYNLKKVIDAKRFTFFRSEDIALTVGGIGKVRAALATSHAISALGHTLNGNISFTFNLLNVGIAGSRSLEQGGIFEISKVHDQGSGRDYYPDLLFTQKLPRASLATFDKPVISSATDFSADCVDMEGAGFCEAASTYVAPSQFALLKVISDRCEGELLDTKKISNMIEAQLPNISRFVIQGLTLADSRKELLSQDAEELLERIEQSLKLSFSECVILRKALRAAIVRSGKIPKLEKFEASTSSTPLERKALFSELLSLLNRKVPHESELN